MIRFYRALLRLYPASFREEYGGEMVAIFRQRLRGAGPAAAVPLVCAAIAERLCGAAAVHRDILAQDVRYAVRSLRRAPAFAATALLLVGGGIGANTAAFSVTDFVLLRPLPYREPDRLVKLWQATPDSGWADIRVRGLEVPSEPQVYLPYRQVEDGSMISYAPADLVIRSTGPPLNLVPAVRAIVRRADPLQPISDVRLLAHIVEEDTAGRAGHLRVLAAFASMAVLLAVVGIHGLLAFAVSQRTQEFGVRLAFGARPQDLARMVLRRAARLALAGIVPGLALAYLAGRSVQALLAGIPPADPVTLAAVAAFTVAMTLAGSLAPARRALRLSPSDALRAEI